MVVQGASRLLDNPEYYDAKKAQQLLEFLSDKEKVFALARDPRPQMIHIRIGPENGEGAMQDASFVFTTYDLGRTPAGSWGVIGPTRMDYKQNRQPASSCFPGGCGADAHPLPQRKRTAGRNR